MWIREERKVVDHYDEKNGDPIYCDKLDVVHIFKFKPDKFDHGYLNVVANEIAHLLQITIVERPGIVGMRYHVMVGKYVSYFSEMTFEEAKKLAFDKANEQIAVIFKVISSFESIKDE